MKSTRTEHLENFFNELKKDGVKFKDVVKYLTKTQQNEFEYVGKQNYHAHINGIHSLLTNTKEFKIKEKFTTNKIKKDFIVTFIGQSQVKMGCRMIKEVDTRKTGKNGTWGLVINSFKVLK